MKVEKQYLLRQNDQVGVMHCKDMNTMSMAVGNIPTSHNH